MGSLIVRPENLLWYTRRKHWGYELLCVPESISPRGWAPIARLLWEKLSVRPRPVSFSGTFRYGSTKCVMYVGTMKNDATLRDHAGRPITHLAIWLRSWADPEMAAKVPTDWFDQFYEIFRPEFETARFYAMPDDEVRAWSGRADGPLSSFLAREFRSCFIASEVSPGEDFGPDQRVDLGEIKILTGNTDSGRNSTTECCDSRKIIATVLAVGLVTLGTWAIWRILR